MDRLKKTRRVYRTLVTRTINELTQLTEEEDPDKTKIKAKLEVLEDAFRKLDENDQSIIDQLIEDDVGEDEQDIEIMTIAEYKENYLVAKGKTEGILEPPRQRTPTGSERSFSTAVGGISKKNFKLPKIQLKKFNGELKEWLGFWAQFSKIHEDEDIDSADKFQYLVQSMVKGSRAQEVVESYPQSAENYNKAIDALKRRFGKDVLLVEVYVRELIRLVININCNKEKVSLASMFDKLESHLRALESLGVTSDKCAAILYPLVESCLPEETLRAWQRSPLSRKEEKPDDPKNGRLVFLMEFLREEVEGEDRIALARTGFGISSKPHSKSKKEEFGEEEWPTASSLFSGQGKTRGSGQCVFCEGNHESSQCIKAQSMTSAEKKNKIQSKRCCFVCLKGGHVSKDCKSHVKCNFCGRRHYIVTCPDFASQKPVGEIKSRTTEKVEKSPEQTQACSQTCSGAVLLKSLMVKFVGENRTRVARLVFDTGCQRTYIKELTAKIMEYKPIGEETIEQSLFGGSTTALKTHRRFQFMIESLDGRHEVEIEALDQPVICGRIPRLTRGPWLKELSEKRIWINDFGDDCPEVEILIGADMYGRLMTGKSIPLRCGLTAYETRLGWTLLGKPITEYRDSTSMMVTSMLVSDAQVADLWKLETIGITDPAESHTKEEKNILSREHFKKTVQREADGRYEVSLPWVVDQNTIPDNRLISEKRLMSATRKLQASGRLADYQKVFDAWMEEGIIEEVPAEELDFKCHYLPHRPVFNEKSKTTPVRPVFDASCKSNRTPSLNDCLEKGPNLLELIPSLVLRFKEKRIGLIADIRKAFLMISVKKEDRDFNRFLWWDEDAKNIKVFRHKRGVFGVNCSVFLLAAVLELHCETASESLKEIMDKFKKSLYVDNVVCSVDTYEEMIKFREETTRLLAEAKMDLRLWENSVGEVPGVGFLSNRKCGLGIGSTSKNTSKVDPGSGIEEESQEVGVLGLTWDKQNDTLSCDLPDLEFTDRLTKRKILSAVQQIYDPMGYLSPALLEPKLLLQEIWAIKTGWDDEVPPEVSEKFRRWAENLGILSQIKIKRWMSEGSTRKDWSLHTFCDASGKAYAAVVFLRCVTECGVSIQLLQSKSRVSPMKKVSIPRLELLACTIGSRLTTSIRSALDMEDVPSYFWSDSTTAIGWIKGNDEWGTFVGNRVKEILKLTKSSDWRHVPGVCNPADLPSRGCNPKQYLESKWWEGPSWLRLPEDQWPVSEVKGNFEEINLEKRKALISGMSSIEVRPWYFNYSSYSKIVRIVGWMKKFIRNCRARYLTVDKVPLLMNGFSCSSLELTVEEINEAEEALVSAVQKEGFPKNKDLGNLKIKKDDKGLIRVETKIARREDSYEFRHPLVMPSNHSITDLLVREVHLKNSHAGVQVMMTKLRERFWILKSRKTIKRVTGKCVRCRRHEGSGFQCESAPLPVNRVKDARVFEVTGVDLAGPLYLKDKSKVWIVLFTCAVYRAVHLELVSSLSTEAFLQAMRRFIARRGRPTIIYSDNGTNFTGSDSAFRALDWKRITKIFSTERMQWKFNPPSAPWWGGWWERLVRMVKKLLVRVLGKSCLNFEELNTVLCDVEATINSRPLTYVSEDSDDLMALTPAMFLQEVSEIGVPGVDILEQIEFAKRFRYRQRLRQTLRSRFRKEYLSQLVQRAGESKMKWRVRIGEVVLIENDNKKKINWPMARVVELFPGQDGHVRVVRLKTSKGTFLRPVQRLFPLEVDDVEALNIRPDETETSSSAEVEANEGVVITRYGRKVKAPERFGV